MIQTVRAIVNPDKLRHLGPVPTCSAFRPPTRTVVKANGVSPVSAKPFNERNPTWTPAQPLRKHPRHEIHQVHQLRRSGDHRVGPPRTTQELVKLRASQINGCGVCTDMHTKEAALPGRANSASTWWRRGGRQRSSPKPTRRAPSAEQGTRIADAAGGVTDEAWAKAASTTTRSSSERWSR